MPNTINFYKGISLHVIPVLIIVPWTQQTLPAELIHLRLNLSYLSYQEVKKEKDLGKQIRIAGFSTRVELFSTLK